VTLGPPTLTRRISQTIFGMALIVVILNLINYLLVDRLGWMETISKPQVWSLILMAVFFGLAHHFPDKQVQIVQIVLIVFLSGPMTLSAPFSFFGMWFFVLGLLLLYKYGFLVRQILPKLGFTFLYFLPFLAISVANNEGGIGLLNRVLGYAVFLVSCLVFLYFIFEAEIRDLLKSNRQKDSALAEKNREIARMEPLSVLGERVAHVTHSFENHLTRLKSITSQLQHTQNTEQAAAMLEEASQTLADRMESILMVSRSGLDLEPEEFDVAKVLEGIKFVYLSEPSFAENVWNETDLRGPLKLKAIRWDFILMVENILKNALDAVQTRGVRGVVKVTLGAGLLTIANNGGAMELCPPCIGSCLECPVYGRNGRGLSQVFSTCRKNGWALRLRTDGDWTIYQILLAVPV